MKLQSNPGRPRPGVIVDQYIGFVNFLDVSLRDDPLGRPSALYFPIPKKDDPVCILAGQVNVMGDDKNG